VKWYFAEEELLLAYDFPCNHGAGSGRMHIGSIALRALVAHATQRNAAQAVAPIIVSGRARSAEGGVPRCATWLESTHRLLRGDWCVRPSSAGRTGRPPAGPPVPTRHESSARGEREGLLSITGQHAAYMEPLKRARFAVAREHRCAVIRPAAIAVPARGSNHQLMRWDGAVEVPPVL
jgi:hypothetical protein